MTAAKVLSLLGFARNAGELAAGADAVRRAAERRRARVVVIATDASARTDQKIRAVCRKVGIPAVAWGKKSALGQAIGSRDVAVVAVVDPQMAQALLDALRGVQVEKGRDVFDENASLRAGPGCGRRK